VLVTAFIIAACGKQVTPNPPGLGAGGALPGYMAVKFDIRRSIQLFQLSVLDGFNTTGNGLTPLTNPQQTNWAAYSTALFAGGSGGATYASAIQFVKNQNPVIPPQFLRVFPTQQQFQYIPNSNGTGSEYQITFQRVIFNPVNATSSPSPPPVSHIWQFNAFTTQATAQNQLYSSIRWGRVALPTTRSCRRNSTSIPVSTKRSTNNKTSIRPAIRPLKSSASRSQTIPALVRTRVPARKRGVRLCTIAESNVRTNHAVASSLPTSLRVKRTAATSAVRLKSAVSNRRVARAATRSATRCNRVELYEVRFKN